MRGRLVGMTAVLLAVAVGCGVPDSGELESIDDDGVPFDLTGTSVVTTTTSTTVAPSTTESPIPTSTLAPTTTIQNELVDLYFASGSRLKPIPQQLAGQPGPEQLLAALVLGPPTGSVGVGLRAIIPRDAELSVDVVDGIVVVDLPADLFDGMSTTDQRLVFGQIVMTMTPRRVGQVLFTLAGEPLPVFLGDGGLSEPDQPVSFDDYSQLMSSNIPEITTTTTTTEPPTTSIDPVATTLPLGETTVGP